MKQKNKIRDRRTILGATAIFFLLLLVGCSPNEPAETAFGEEKIIALSTINIINDFVKNVAGENIEAISLLPVGTDPHVYEPVPRDVQQIVAADIVFYNGYHLEKWLEELLENAGGSRPAYQVTTNLEPRRNARNDPDPHLWMDPVAAITYVENIRDVLAEFDPEHAAAYEKNAQEYIAELKELDAWIRTRIQEIPPENRKLVTTHDAYAYFGERYGLEVAGSIWGITTEDEPSAQEIAKLVNSIIDKKVPAVFVETTINPKLMARVAKDAEVKLGKPLYGDSLGLPGSGAETYIGMTQTNVNNIVEGLQ